MSQRRFALNSFLALLILSLAPHPFAHGQGTVPATAPTTAPTTAPEPMVDNPHYLVWSKQKVGTTVEYDLNVTVHGQTMNGMIVATLGELTPERAVVQSSTKMSIPGLPNAQEQKQTQTHNAKVPQSEAERALMPLGATGESKDAGKETIMVDGKPHECTVREFTGKIQGADAKGKMWRSESVPGGMVKTESEGSPNMTMKLMLKKVSAK